MRINPDAGAADHQDEMSAPSTDPAVLLAVVEAQRAIATADLDLEAVMELVCAQAQALTPATGAVVGLLEAGAPVRRVAGGIAASEAAETLDVPLVFRGAPLGVLTVLSARPGAFTAADAATLSLLSDLIAAHLRHAQVYARAEEASREDPLTGLGNHRAYDERLAAEVARGIRHGRPLTLCLIEVPRPDDATMQRVGRALCAVRACDQAFRVGPDRFALLLPETAEREADVVLRRLEATLCVRDASGTTVHVVTARKQARHREVDRLRAAAEEALERAPRPAAALPAAA